MIEVQHLIKVYNGQQVVDDISFRLEAGKTLVLLGTSGCGKTTTLRMLNRLIEPTSGKVLIDQKDISTGQPEILRRDMGYILQRNSLFPHYTVLENISVVPKLLNWTKARTLDRTKELMQKLHLSENKLYAYPKELSGGEAQRVNIARALVANPAILLMDEPFSALDNLTRISIRKEFAELEELKNKTIVLVTHDVEEAFEMGDVICLMDSGRIVQQGSPAALLFHPANDFVCDFLSDSFLQLSLTITKIADIFPFLPTASQIATAGIPAKMTDTIGRVLSRIQDKNNTREEITIVNGGVAVTTTNWMELMNAFTRYKAQD